MGLSKSILEPKNVVPYLGFKCDSVGAFRRLPEKREKFVRLLESLLSSEKVSLMDLQRLSGKCMFMSLAVLVPDCLQMKLIWLFQEHQSLLTPFLSLSP